MQSNDLRIFCLSSRLAVNRASRPQGREGHWFESNPEYSFSLLTKYVAKKSCEARLRFGLIPERFDFVIENLVNFKFADYLLEVYMTTLKFEFRKTIFMDKRDVKPTSLWYPVCGTCRATSSIVQI